MDAVASFLRSGYRALLAGEFRHLVSNQPALTDTVGRRQRAFLGHEYGQGQVDGSQATPYGGEILQYFKDHKLLYPVNGPEERTWRMA